MEKQIDRVCLRLLLLWMSAVTTHQTKCGGTNNLDVEEPKILLKKTQYNNNGTPFKGKS